MAGFMRGSACRAFLPRIFFQKALVYSKTCINRRQSPYRVDVNDRPEDGEGRNSLFIHGKTSCGASIDLACFILE
jgi:hypothetical protein